MQRKTQQMKANKLVFWDIFPPQAFFFLIKAAPNQDDEGRMRLGSLVELRSHTAQSAHEYA